MEERQLLVILEDWLLVVWNICWLFWISGILAADIGCMENGICWLF